jgi:eukaryotic-like serine/threonine-protein kinase
MTARQCPQCDSLLDESTLGGLCPICTTRVCFFGGVPEAADLAGGTAPLLFGDYEIIEQLDRGGMGVVFKARQRSLNRTVALKLISAGQFATVEEHRRFRIEAEAAATLDHPNIVPIYEVGAFEGRAFFSMKLFSGGSLAKYLLGAGQGQQMQSNVSGRSESFDERGGTGHAVAGEFAAAYRQPRPTNILRPDATAESAAIIAKVARAVHHAHERGILHRDLKPANILFDDAGEPHVTDFGLAKFTSADTTAGATLSGSVLGTPGYMAPEQALGEANAVTIAADIFSLGAVLYHLLTGKAPFAGNTAVQTMRNVIEREPQQPREISAAVDLDLETICLKCLEKEPSRRYASALALAEDLERWRRGEPIVARPITRRERVCKWAQRRPAVAALSGVAALLFITGVGGVAFEWRRAEHHARRAEDALQRSHEALWQANFERARALRTSGQIGQRVKALQAIRAAAALRQTPELRDEAVAALALPDLEEEGNWHRIPSNSLNVVVDSLLRRYATVDARGVSISRLIDGRRLCRIEMKTAGYRGVALSPDGEGVAFLAKDDLRIWQVPSTNLLLTISNVHTFAFGPDSRTLACVMPDKTLQMHSFSNALPVTRRCRVTAIGPFAFSPSGDRVAFATQKELQIWTTSPPQLQYRTTDPDQAWYRISWHPDGKGLVASTHGYRMIGWQPDEKFVADYPQQPREGLHLWFHPSGELFASMGWDSVLRLWSPAARQPLLQAGIGSPLGFSDDGERLAVFRGEEIGTFRVHLSPECRMMGLPGGRRLSGRSVAFSPSGVLAFSSEDGVWLQDRRHIEPARRVRSSRAEHLAFPDDENLFLVGSSGRLYRYPVLSGSEGHSELGPAEILWSNDHVGSFALHSGGKLAMALGYDAGMLDLETRALLFKCRASPEVSGMSFSASGEWFAAGYWNTSYSGGGQVHVFSARDGRELHRFEGGNSATTFSPDNAWLFHSTPQEHRQISTETWTITRTYPIAGLNMISGGMTFRADGAVAALQASERAARLIDPSTGQSLLTLTAPLPMGGVRFAWSRDRRWLVQVALENSMMWDLQVLQKSLRELGLASPALH